MELIQYIQLVRRWWWLFVIMAVLAGGAASVYSQLQDAVYQAEVKVFIGGFTRDPNPAAGEIQTSTDLAATYSNLVTVRPTLEATIAALNLDLDPGALAGQITTAIVPETSILIIRVQDGSAVQAANIANELANQLILNSPTNLTPEQEQQRGLLAREINELGLQITDARQQIIELDAQIEGGAENQAELQAQQLVLISQISDWQQSIADLSSSIGSFDTQTNTLQVVEPALTPSNPINQNLLRNAALATMVGLALAFGIVLLIEYMDDSFRSPEDVQHALELPVLAGIVKFGKKRDSYSDKLVTLRAPNSAPVEGYRMLRTNLLYQSEMMPSNRIIVTSPRMSEGKSVTAANLAVSLAKADFYTVLIDADLHRPQVHNSFNVDNNNGLTNIFKTNIRPTETFTEAQLNSLLQATEVPTLKVIPSGPLPANPAELMGLFHLKILCDSLEAIGVQVIIFDCPPIMAVVDGLALSSNVGATAVLVVEAARTRRDNAVRVVRQLEQVGVKIAGVVLNRITSRTPQYTYYYGYGNYGK